MMVSHIRPLMDMLVLSSSWKALSSPRKYRHYSSRTIQFMCSSSSAADGSSPTTTTTTHITSTQSSTVKKIQNLLNRRKKRYQDRQVVLEGPRMVLDLFQSQPHLVRQVVMEESLYETLAPQLVLVAGGGGGGPRIATATQKVLTTCTDTVTNQGVLAVCDMPPSDEKHDGPENDDDDDTNDSSHLSLVLDGVSDPGNFGTLIRSAVASGVVHSIFCLPNCCDPWNPKAVRSAAGATFAIWSKVHMVDSWTDLRTRHLSPSSSSSNPTTASAVYAATMGDGRRLSQPYYSVSYANSAIVIGNEGQGLSEAVREDPDVQAVHIPMKPGSVESLNAGVCGSILLFEAQRQKAMLLQEE